MREQRREEALISPRLVVVVVVIVAVVVVVAVVVFLLFWLQIANLPQFRGREISDDANEIVTNNSNNFII